MRKHGEAGPSRRNARSRLGRKRDGLAICVALLTIALGLACTRDLVSPKTSQTEQSKSLQVPSEVGARTRRYTKDELHSRNRLDWFGQAHNHVLELTMAELRKPDVNLTNLCERMQVVLSNADAFAPFTSKMKKSSEAEMRAALRESPICDPQLGKLGQEILRGKQRITRRVSFTSTAVNEPGDSAIALYEATVAETEQATDAQDLASRLSPILDASNGLTGLDADFVLMAVSVAQYSFEYWSSGGDQELVDEIMTTDIEPCYAGQAENEVFEADGSTFQCQNQQWRQIRFQGPKRSQAMFQLASYPGALVGNCFQDGFNYRWRIVGAADVAGLGVAGLMSKLTGPNPWYLAGVAAVSIGAGIYEAGRWIKCNVVLQ